jgi:RND family efflux transporter MFP subunit
MNHDDRKQETASVEKPSTEGLHLRRWIVVGVAILVVAAIALALMLTRGSSRTSTAGRPVPEPAIDPFGSNMTTSTAPRAGETVITLSPDKLANAHLKIEEATSQQGASVGGMRATGSVLPNAYKEVPVLPIAGGIVRQVKVQLGDRVQAGQPLAVIFSTDLVEAQTAYLKMLADYEEHHLHHKRAVELVKLGASSREELEQSTARYKTAQAEVASSRQRLLLLGMTDKQIDALVSAEKVAPLISVESPASGTVLSRSVNVGEVVMEGKELFRVADLSTVWVMGQIYERDFSVVHVGKRATVTTTAYPGKSFAGRVSYIDPRVDPATRTAQVRVEVTNPSEMLRIGMFVDIVFGDAPAQSAMMIPRAAVQSLGAKQVVYVATSEHGVFIQRDVVAGAEANGMIPVLSGINAGERVVTEGSFLLRAESFKLNPAQLASAPAQSQQPSPEPEAREQSLRIAVSEKGFEPAVIRLKRGVLARLTFVRKIEVTCATEVVIEEFSIRRELPFNEPVVVKLTPEKAGEFTFSCGMNMVSGKIIVR